ncbi:hypothetical protein [Mesorhizobium sp.]|uniref:hypothetical protein n=1 Tax=Mesorhizobium sp. TaxID=1871066 RepID=UPI0025FDB1D3|nr:hypothetical protein [Mesorhizobium sp.]
MEPRNKQRPARQKQSEAAAIERQERDAPEGRIPPDSVAVNGDPRDDAEAEGTLPEEDDDNPYQESDEALPNDEEERSLARDPSKEGSRFDEV